MSIPAKAKAGNSASSPRRPGWAPASPTSKFREGTGKTVAIRAAVAGPDPASHTVIYIGNPSAGVPGYLELSRQPGL